MKLIMNGTDMITKADIKAELKKLNTEEQSKGMTIRTLFAGGLSVKEISDLTAIGYNHVYNVCKNEVVKHGLGDSVDSTRAGGSKKKTILEHLALGKTITEVSRDLGCLYNQVWQVAKEYGYTNKQKAQAATLEVK